MATLGLVTLSLPEKLYFYHSAAECFFAGALALLAAYSVWTFNVGLKNFGLMGLGFAFGIGSLPLFLISTLLLSLDDIIRCFNSSALYTKEMACLHNHRLEEEWTKQSGTKTKTGSTSEASKGRETEAGTSQGGQTHLQRLVEAAQASNHAAASGKSASKISPA